MKYAPRFIASASTPNKTRYPGPSAPPMDTRIADMTPSNRIVLI
ncbi:hypothetical protein WMF27_40275 [Sorangium sp. So ce281]